MVDEAHETSFKQEEGVRYNARDVAVMRGHFEKVPVVLASATPALESLQMAERVYKKVDLPSRFGGAEIAGDRDDRPDRRKAAAGHVAGAAAGRRDRGTVWNAANNRCCS